MLLNEKEFRNSYWDQKWGQTGYNIKDSDLEEWALKKTIDNLKMIYHPSKNRADQVGEEQNKIAVRVTA